MAAATQTGYTGGGFNQNWHERWLRDGSWKSSNGPVKNRDLWERLFGLVWDGRRDVTFEWIPGHAGDPNNQRVTDSRERQHSRSADYLDVRMGVDVFARFHN